MSDLVTAKNLELYIYCTVMIYNHGKSLVSYSYRFTLEIQQFLWIAIQMKLKQKKNKRSKRYLYFLQY